MEAGLREIADACGVPLIVYLKSEDGFGSDLERGLDAVGRLVDDGVAVAIKYAVVRDDAAARTTTCTDCCGVWTSERVISGMGERPAIVHLRDFELGGLTTGSGCIAPRRCSELFAARRTPGLDTRPRRCRELFMPLEDLRDAWGPARVLHHAIRAGRHRPIRTDSALRVRACPSRSSTQLAPVAQSSPPETDA